MLMPPETYSDKWQPIKESVLVAASDPSQVWRAEEIELIGYRVTIEALEGRALEC